MAAVIFHVIAWPTLGIAVLVFGFAPGAVLRLIVILYERDHARRRELLAELYGVPRIERPFWVAEQLEIAIFEGLRGRLAVRRAKQRPQAEEGGSDHLVSDGPRRPGAPQMLPEELRQRMRAAVEAERKHAAPGAQGVPE